MEKKIIEQAAWLGQKEAGIFKSILNSRVSVGTLLDGAHLGGPGEGILRPFFNEDLRKIDLGLFGNRNSTRIAASNPGIKIMASRFLQSQISGDVLAVLDGKKFHPITHDEAKSVGLIEERHYHDIFTYNGDLDGRLLFRKIKQQQDEGGYFSPLPETAHQVTKRGHGRIFLVNKDNISR